MVLVGNPEGKRPITRLTLRQKDNGKLDIQETDYGLD
jgi:hypothetical protein